MQPCLNRTRAVISLDALRRNVDTIFSVLDGTPMMAIVKADAYGHGAERLIPELESMGAAAFGVATAAEALAARRLTDKMILVLGWVDPACAAELARNDITVEANSLEYASALSENALCGGCTLKVHIKLDTGMGRIGFDAADPDGTLADLRRLYALKGIEVTGIFTHFACADEFGDDSVSYTENQFSMFCGIISALENEGFGCGVKHCCNSAASLSRKDMHLDMVRCGIILYGLLPSPECAGLAPLEPILSLYSTVTQVKVIPAGRCVSYGRTYTADMERRIASVAIGYADGYSRSLSGRARMIVNGEFAPVVGRVCMDQLMLDVTGIDGVLCGSTVTIVGSEGDKILTLDEMASLRGTINYECSCNLSERIVRLYR